MGDVERAVVRVETEIAAIPAEQWDACANPVADRYNPFVSHGFLHALESSGAVSPRSGWVPLHLVLDDGSGGVAACMPCYVKSHSQGEYVFDHAWADAFERAGGRYYPKLQCAVPFTPVTGPRLLVRGEEERERCEPILIQAATELVERSGASSLHITFLTHGEWRRLGAFGLLQRTDKQFHWHNRGYGSFDDFLASLASRKRKSIRKERREALADGISIEWLTGRDISEAHWDAFFAFYMDTGSRKWGRPYLNRTFFSHLGQAMAERILLVMCRRAGRYIAGALNLIGGDALYGRYWGCLEDHSCLHFEACYYQAIEFAIAHGLARVEAGAQGPHKIARGYLPETTYSVHFIANPALRRAIADYLGQERAYVAAEADMLAEHSPYRRCGAHET